MDQAVQVHLVVLKATPSQVPVNKNGSEVYIIDQLLSNSCELHRIGPEKQKDGLDSPHPL